MSRCYEQLECGCLISCDGGGGLIPGCDEKNCSVEEYMKTHRMIGGYCEKCHPVEFSKELQRIRENCLECFSSDMLNYYTKEEGNYKIEYWRCNECLNIIEVKINLEDNKVIDFKSYRIYENVSND